SNQTGQMLAALLQWPQATFASHIEMDQQQITVQRELDAGLQTLQLQLPCVITTDLRLNTPRFAKLPDMMRAKAKPLANLSVESLGLSLTAHQVRQS
ncbi:electron transfer flavoprotein subunit beta/FixA family protein, partial [Acinetobacter baumannii]